MTEALAPSVATGAIAFKGQDRIDAGPELLLSRPLRNHFSPSPFPQLRQSAWRLLRRVDRYPGLYVHHAAGFALAALIAYQCAALYGAIVMPLEGRPEQTARPPQLQRAALLTSFDPFFTDAAAGAASAAGAAPIASTGLTLHGYRQDRRTGGGSAIISHSDGAQRSVGIGEEIAPGIVLKQIGPDHVIIVRHGLDQRLAFNDFASTGSATTPAVRTVPSPYTPTPAASPIVENRPRPSAPRGTTLPARSIDFADPSTLPASLTTPKR